MRLLIIDNYDSFTYNIVHAIRSLGIEPDIYRNDMISINQIEQYDKIIISPGPGIPSEAGIVPEMLKRYAASKPILGICLGHQAIGECFGATLKNLPTVYHGVKSTIEIHTDDYLFAGLPAAIEVGRYHSWVVSKDNFPACLEILATSPDGEIMALRHREHDIRGVQFHPESILTPEGITILRNWINH